MTEDPQARAARLRAQSEEGATNADRRLRAKEWAEEQVAAVRGTARSEHGDVTATVDHSGLLLRLELSPLTKQAKQDDLAHAITAVVRQATADARNQVREVYERLRNEGVIRSLPPFLLPAPDVRAVELALPVRGNAPVKRAGDHTEEGPPESWLKDEPW
ncbi:YbaB/EbfC family nucleoid-associated protein [Lentzea sp. CC55]|uniref:YbaB/EbfC family nucleoid-associated protein n=1 Tax=Lentzea sp. CC55 TaxID=2884909 RepID=UPI001EECFF5C|nr:YbaB/EbfC family nucleoid-associated protein [Lentzea sp. CC55]MCG8921321.1 YbaB/EbfC family nucleoid-associated protein [Lentzea sp. CC55]